MQSARHPNVGLSAALISAVGGEPLAGSGFETEEFEQGFLTEELEEEGW